ncbi:tumor necrosis factor ligand superfamily member 11-like [Sardina pilchardus]|uniref:tumor necrosis factor ligand superfamily member 11-like n=1 Tax=Sardina pilchardus TaxID=27697 RepID=UPI002E142428
MEPRTSRLLQPYLMTPRAPVTVIVAIMALMQILCCVIVGLHLTGHFQVHGADRAPAAGETPAEPQQKQHTRVPKRHKSRTPVAHLPINPASASGQRDVHATIVHWSADRGHLAQLQYRDGRILFRKPGQYYVYAQTCFRYYNEPEVSAAPSSRPAASSNTGHQHAPPAPPAAPSPVQLIQYVFLERPNRGSPLRSSLVMKAGSTQRWHSGYHMSCQHQGRVVALRPGDGLYVSVANAWMLDPEAEGSYFGAFRVAE